MNKFVIAITGPAGVGKSTVAEGVARSFDKCVNIEADHIKHMIVSGFYEDDSMPGGGGFTEWGLVGDSIGLLAANFLDSGFSVVVNGYIDESAWKNIEKHVTITHKFLLLPDLNTVLKRDSGRSEDATMGEETVRQHYTIFSANDFYNSFRKLDTAAHTAGQTVGNIVKIISQSTSSQ